MNKFLIYPIAAIFCLCACAPEAKNPLADHDPKIVAAFLYDNTGPAIGECAKIWARPDQANTTVIESCENAAFSVAQLLEKEGYGKITSDNIKFPAIWVEYNRIGEEKLKNHKPFSWGPIAK